MPSDADAYASHTLDHHGLVAGMVDELGLVEKIDAMIPQDLGQRQVSVGMAVKAMVLIGLGFVQRALYLTPDFFRGKPVGRLLGPGITAGMLNDDALGRALDAIFAFGVEAFHVNQRGKITRDPGKTALNFFHPGVVQPSGAFAGATWGDTHGIHSRNQTASFCGGRERQRDCPRSSTFPSDGPQGAEGAGRAEVHTPAPARAQAGRVRGPTGAMAGHRVPPAKAAKADGGALVRGASGRGIPGFL